MPQETACHDRKMTSGVLGQCDSYFEIARKVLVIFYHIFSKYNIDYARQIIIVSTRPSVYDEKHAGTELWEAQ